MEAAIKIKQDVLRILYQHRARLSALGVSRLGLFGSFVRGEQHPDSDIDFLVEFEAGQKITAINAYLEEQNQQPKPFIWTKTADQILEKLEPFYTDAINGS